jgi:hypothetical protein
VIKLEMPFGASGTPAAMALDARSLPPELGPARPPKTVTITVNSVPQGAALKVDGKEIGTTPKQAELSVGKHDLQFDKEGFNTGHFPVEIGANDISGGSVSYELGTAAHDTLELRDGSVLTGDLESVSPTEVRVRVAGSEQAIERNKIKRILLVERTPPQ